MCKNKTWLVENLDLKNIVIIDVSPYCLNKEDTPLTYRGSKKKDCTVNISRIEYRKIVIDSWKWHLRPKIKAVLRNNTRIVFRYITVHDILKDTIRCLINIDFNLGLRDIKFIKHKEGNNYSIDTNDLARIFESIN